MNRNKYRSANISNWFRAWFAFWIAISSLIAIYDENTTARAVFLLHAILSTGSWITLEINAYIARGSK